MTADEGLAATDAPVGGPHVPLIAPVPGRPPFPGFLWSVLLVIAVFLTANCVSVPVMMILGLMKYGAAAFGAMIRTPEGWLQLVSGMDVALLSIPSNSIGFGLIIWLGWRHTGRSFSRVFPFRPVPLLSWVGVAVTFAGGLLTANLASDLLLKVLPVPEWVIDFFSQFLGKDKGITSYVLLAVVAPLTEEFLFRGLILSGLAGRYRFLPVCLLSAALFGAMHLLPWQVLPAFLLGVLFAWWRLETGSLWPPLVAHVLTNSIAYYQGMNSSVEEALTAPPQPLWLSALGIFILVAGFFWSRTLFRRDAALASATTV